MLARRRRGRPGRLEAFSVRDDPTSACGGGRCGDLDAEQTVTAVADSSYGFGEGLNPYVRLTLSDRALWLDGAGDAAVLPLAVGSRYRFETAAASFGLGLPTAAALRVSDAAGLVLYGVTAVALPDNAPAGSGMDAVLLLPDGWSFAVEDGDVGTEPAGCGGTATAARVAVAYGGARVRLVQGERARLGGYDVEVHVARRVLYDGSCLDGYVPEFSVVAARRSD